MTLDRNRSTRSLLARAEELLSEPTLAHAEEARALLGEAVGRFRPDQAARLRPALRRVSALLEAGWRARLGLYRIAAAGQAGYRPDGVAQDFLPGSAPGPGLTVEG